MCVIESEIGVCLPRKALDLATQKCKNQRAPKPSSNPHKGSKIAHITGLDCLYTYLCTMKTSMNPALKSVSSGPKPNSELFNMTIEKYLIA